MSRPPNILLILTDHFRRDALGESTPNLMRLAARGVRFANAYCASPLCQPARVSIVTGKLPSQHGICGNQSPPISSGLREDTFMNHLRRQGYFGALVGKHHFLDRFGEGKDVTEDDPELRRYGFDTVVQVVDEDENLHNSDRYTRHLGSRGLLERYRSVFTETAWECRPHPFEADDTVDGFIGNQGLEFIRSVGAGRPFYLNLSFIGPHPPYWHPGELAHDPEAVPEPLDSPASLPPERGSVRYQAQSLSARENRAHYLDRCALIDRYIGGVLEALEERGLAKNTVVLFSSDHGDNLGDFGIWDKRFFYEQCAGVPLLMAGPGVPGELRRSGSRVSKALVSHLDLYPTLLDLAGVERRLDHTFFGRSLLPVLAGEPGALHPEVTAELATAAMIRTAGWKMVFDPEQGGVTHLFNLNADPRELDNLAGRAGYAGVTAALTERLLALRIRLTQNTRYKEEKRLQRVRVG